ncbi:hypothetical protein AMTRI_Chr03g50410 [Amborella trichopoda]
MPYEENPKKPFYIPKKATNPFFWLAAIACSILASAVIITCLVVFIGYMVYKPRIPSIAVTYAHLDRLDYDQYSQLQTQITLIVTAENDNRRAHARFSDLRFLLYFQGLPIADLRAASFDVPKNSSLPLHYVVQSAPVPLGGGAMEEINSGLQNNKIPFTLKGSVRTRWRLGGVGSVKFTSHLYCYLEFFPPFINGSSISKACGTKSQ